MIILEDSRQQLGKHDTKHKWFAEHGIEIRRTKLWKGDYTLPTNQSICIDTKKDFQEIISDIIYQKKHEDKNDLDENGNPKMKTAFEKEADDAFKAGIHLVILIENDGGEVKKGTGIYNPVITKLEDVHKWKNPRLFIMSGRRQKYPKATKGSTLQKMLTTFAKNHGCEFQFCHSRDSARKIVEILTGKENEDE